MSPPVPDLRHLESRLQQRPYPTTTPNVSVASPLERETSGPVCPTAFVPAVSESCVEIPHPSNANDAGVYILICEGEIVYVGSSGDVRKRVAEHAFGESPKTFDRVLFLRLPAAVHGHYEGALIRALWPRYCLGVPRHSGCDNEILDGLGLPTHTDERANAQAWLSEATRRRMAAYPNRPRTRLARDLVHHRERAKLSQSELAKAVGVSLDDVVKWERGDARPTDEQLARSCRALSIPGNARPLTSGIRQ